MPLISDARAFLDRLLARVPAGQRESLDVLRRNVPIERPLVLRPRDLELDEETDTDLQGVSVSLDASAEVILALYPSGEDVTLGDFTLHELEEAFALEGGPPRFVVPPGRVLGALEVGARMKARLDGSASEGTASLSFFAEGGAGAVVRVLRTFEAALGARDVALRTAGSLRTFFDLGSHRPGPDEILVTGFSGSLHLGASLDFGWSVGGTAKTGAGLADVELAADYHARATLGVGAEIRLEQEIVAIVRGLERPGWVNVTFRRKRHHEGGLAVNLSVDAKVATRGPGGGADGDVGPFLDSLLQRTPLPDLLARLRSVADVDLEETGKRFVEDVTGQVGEMLQGWLGGPVSELDRKLQPVRDLAEQLLEVYRERDADVLRFLEESADRVSELAELDGAVRLIAGAESAEDLLIELAGPGAGAVRTALDAATTVLGIDLSQLGWLEERLAALKDLATRVEALGSSVRSTFEERYRALKRQLQIDDAVELLRNVHDAPTLQDLLSRRIVWVQEYLSRELGERVEDLAQRAQPAIDAIRKITDGYDHLVGQTRDALQHALNQEIGFQASLAWQRLRENQALASVDLNLEESEGRDAMRDLRRGDLRKVMTMRLAHAGAIRFRKSYFLDMLRSSVSLRTVVNGRESLRARSLLLSRQAVLEPTETGEIWVESSQVDARFQRRNRRAMIQVHTLFEISLQETLELRGQELESQGLTLAGVGLSYGYQEAIQEEISAESLVARVRQVISGIDFPVVPPAEFESLLEQIRRVGVLGDLTQPVLDIRVQIDRDALVHLFQGDDTTALAGRVRDAYDRAVHLTFAGMPRLLHFYDSNRLGNPQIGDAGLTRWQIPRPQQMMAESVTMAHSTFVRRFVDIHRKVFRPLREAGPGNVSLSDPQRHKLALTLRKQLRNLGRKMEWVNRLEPGDQPHDFTMAVVAELVEPGDRAGGIAVTYHHPISGEVLTLRVDDPFES